MPQAKLKPHYYSFLIKALRPKIGSLTEMIVNSNLYIDKTTNLYTGAKYRKLYISVDPDTYIKYQNDAEHIGQVTQQTLNEIGTQHIDRCKTKADMRVYEMQFNDIEPVRTEWQEIDDCQEDLIQQFREARTSLQYMNIGNTCRTIMIKLANIVYDPEIHSAPDYEPLSENKYLKRLEVYIRYKLGHSSSKRDFMLSAIDTLAKASILTQSTTHNLQSDHSRAQFSVTVMILFISIIKLVHESD